MVFGQGWRHGHGGKQTDIGHVLETEPTAFAHCMSGEREESRKVPGL